VPLLLFVVVLLFNFDGQTFADNLWGGPETEKTLARSGPRCARRCS